MTKSSVLAERIASVTIGTLALALAIAAAFRFEAGPIQWRLLLVAAALVLLLGGALPFRFVPTGARSWQYRLVAIGMIAWLIATMLK